MKIEIKHWFTGKVIFECEADSLKLAVELAVEKGASLDGASLDGASLRNASLDGASRLETGEMWEQYLRDVVPALCTAGGRTLGEVAAAWNCHSWENCPMAVAFGVHGEEGVPVLYRLRVRQFVRLFDANLIPCPVKTAGAGACEVKG